MSNTRTLPQTLHNIAHKLQKIANTQVFDDNENYPAIEPNDIAKIREAASELEMWRTVKMMLFMAGGIELVKRLQAQTWTSITRTQIISILSFMLSKHPGNPNEGGS